MFLIIRIKEYVYECPRHTCGLKKLENLRSKFDKKYITTNQNYYFLKYRQYMREFNFLDKYLYKQYIPKFETSIKSNPKSFWRSSLRVVAQTYQYQCFWGISLRMILCPFQIYLPNLLSWIVHHLLFLSLKFQII